MNNTIAKLTQYLDSLSREQLTALTLQLAIDGTFGLLNRDIAKILYNTLESGKTLLFIDLANMHGLNHAYSMTQADQFINNVLDGYRQSDTWIRWGSDEFICILNSGCIVELIDRLYADMTANNLYAVYGYVTTSESLCETVQRADSIVMQAKCQLEKLGLKASRDEAYTVKESIVVTE